MAIHEPKNVPRCLAAESIAFVPTAGMRLAPEVLVLELYREVFYEDFSMGKERRLSIKYGEKEVEKGEMAVLEATRGRKLQPQSKVETQSEPFYTPVYPEQASRAWLRKQSDRVIRDHLLRGPIGEAITEFPEKEKKKWASTTVKSLLGNHRMRLASGGGAEVEFLWLAIGSPGQPTGMLNERDAEKRLLELVERQSFQLFSAEKGYVDPLARRIFKDFNSIIRAEQKIARMQWMDILKTFLRFSTSIWLLSHMKIMSLLHHWIMAVLEGMPVPNERDIVNKIRGRSESLLQLTLEPTNERIRHISQFMRSRVEISCLLKELQQFDEKKLLDKELTLAHDSAQYLTISTLLGFIRDNHQRLDMSGLPPRVFVTRKAECFNSWRRPLKAGVGKNIDEFLRVLRRLPGDDFDQAYLETPRGKRGDRGKSIVFPGPALIRLVALLANWDETEREKQPKRLLLSAVEKHFGSYGIDFEASATARPRMIESLQQQGLLRGSPDAGDSVAVTPAF